MNNKKVSIGYYIGTIIFCLLASPVANIIIISLFMKGKMNDSIDKHALFFTIVTIVSFLIGIGLTYLVIYITKRILKELLYEPCEVNKYIKKMNDSSTIILAFGTTVFLILTNTITIHDFATITYYCLFVESITCLKIASVLTLMTTSNKNK